MKKGFTLVELLAVIVILAIIALIAVPIIINIIENTKEASIQRSAELYINAFENTIVKTKMTNNKVIEGCSITNGEVMCSGEAVTVDIKGQTPKCGDINFKNGVISSYSINIDGTLITKDIKGVTTTKKTDSCSIITVDLLNGLTPVAYKNGKWTIVSPTSGDWYNYDDQKWANAVTLIPGSTKKEGDTIEVDGDNPDITTMFVYLPRYEYMYTDMGDKYAGGTREMPGEIKVNFILNSQTKPSSDDCYIHPAFWWDDNSNENREKGEELNGIWISKFELSHEEIKKGDKWKYYLHCSDESCTDADKILIRPNIVSLGGNDQANYFYLIKSMSNSNIFNLTNADSHMIKNREWGAMAYLSQSKYGKYGNDNYNGKDKKIYSNNSFRGYDSASVTGRSSGSYVGQNKINDIYINQDNKNIYSDYGFYSYDGYQIKYPINEIDTSISQNIFKGTGASTTGTIYGIYDTVGGLGEMVMGVLYSTSYNTIFSKGNTDSGFAGLNGNTNPYSLREGKNVPQLKYLDKYTISYYNYATKEKFRKGEFEGHALKETLSWDIKNGSLPSLYGSAPWYTRGGFATDYYLSIFNIYNVASNTNYTTRVVLTKNSK